MSQLQSTLIISTYNFPKALELVLKSLENQTILPTEVLVADDGSTEETKGLIAYYKNKLSIPLHHIWHEDVGFTKAIILNKTIAKANGNYIIQVDGDCIMHKNFVKDHIDAAETGQYLYGSRVNIQKEFLPELFSNKIVDFSMFSKGIKKRTRALYAPFLSLFYKSKTEYSKKFRGCNTSFYKTDFVSVNGYNEDFKGWGREDSELAIRFHNYGLKAKRLRYKGIVYHVYHNEKPKNRLEINNDIQLNTINQKVVWCKNGIDKYLNAK